MHFLANFSCFIRNRSLSSWTPHTRVEALSWIFLMHLMSFSSENAKMCFIYAWQWHRREKICLSSICRKIKTFSLFHSSFCFPWAWVGVCFLWKKCILNLNSVVQFFCFIYSLYSKGKRSFCRFFLIVNQPKWKWKFNFFSQFLNNFSIQYSPLILLFIHDCIVLYTMI